jgi:uncharacterized protein YdeI (YjbR/CyaY-like superfamily)
MAHAATLPYAQDVLDALRASPEAEAAFNALPPSHRAEYLTWIDESKKPETRARRILGMITRLV